MKYLITGGAGFIGTNLAKALLEQGDSVVVIDNYAGGKKEERFLDGVTYIEGDIRDREALLGAMKGVDGVFHMAALPRMSDSVEKPAETHDVNVNGTLTVLLAARDSGVRRVVFSSSCAAYGDRPREEHPLKEDVVVRAPLSPYGLHKLTGEHYCRLFSQLYNLQTVNLIYFNVYGPYSDPDGAYALVIGKFMKMRKEGKPLTVSGDGEYYRDYVHVRDIAKANILAMTSSRVGTGESINVGNNEPHSVNDLVTLIGGPSVFVDARPGDMRYAAADSTKAKELLGWEPTMSLPDGIAALKQEWGIV